jgi:hypothetical protein
MSPRACLEFAVKTLEINIPVFMTDDSVNDMALDESCSTSPPQSSITRGLDLAIEAEDLQV